MELSGAGEKDNKSNPGFSDLSSIAVFLWLVVWTGYL